MGQLSLAELQLCHPEMETALVTSGNDIPSTHPALGLSRTRDLLWSKGTGTELSWWCSPFLCDLRRGGEVVINCSLVIKGITGSRHPFFFPGLALQKATPDLPVQLLPNLVLSRGYGLREKKNPTIKSVSANPDPADRKGVGSATHDRRLSRSMQSDSPQMAEEQGTLLAHTAQAFGSQAGIVPNLLSWTLCGSVSPLKTVAGVCMVH